jgi:hypothetical protein
VKRAATILISLIAPVAAWSQVTTPATDAVKSAFLNLMPSSSIRVSLSGTDKLGPTTTDLRGELYWWMTDSASRGAQSAKVEYANYRNGIQDQRAVGNGISFFNFSPLKNEYWVTRYGSFSDTQPDRYMVNLADDFTSAMKGSTTYLARLVREVYVVGGFRAWIPGGQEQLVIDQQTVTDPVVSTRTYVGTPDTEYAMFWIGSPAKKSIVFELTAGNAGWGITRIYFAEKSILGGQSRLVDWTADVNTDFVPATNDFVFVPPVSAKPVIGPRPNIG